MASCSHGPFLLSISSNTGASSCNSTLSFLHANPRSKPLRICASLDESRTPNFPEGKSYNGENTTANSDPVKLAFAKAYAYRKSKKVGTKWAQNPLSKPDEVERGRTSSPSNAAASEIPPRDMLSMEEAKEYKKNEKIIGMEENISAENEDPGLEATNAGNLNERDRENRTGKTDRATISSIDFLGLDFSGKKNKGTPTGLAPLVDPFAYGDLPEVELIVGDGSKFGAKTSSLPHSVEEGDTSDIYKPKVSTWGVFPRPSNISKTFGGGRVIRPGELLETAEDKASKEARTKQLLAAYKNKMGLTIDPRTKVECEKSLTKGNHLMDLGKLQEALTFYEKVMSELSFQSELHGLAALQWSICQDSLSRPNEARVMYERLQAHPNAQVRKKARHFVFGFQAMEMMKVSSSSSKTTAYQKFFDAFVEERANYTTTTTPKVEEVDESLKHALPYIAILVSPLLLILFLAVRKVIFI